MRKIKRKLKRNASLPLLFKPPILCATIGHKPSCSIGKSVVVPPGIGATQTFMTVGAFDTQAEAEACNKYINTKFVAAMLSILKVTQHNARETWAKVPMQDFNPATSDIDRQLYRKYKLNWKEIAFIETNFKYRSVTNAPD